MSDRELLLGYVDTFAAALSAFVDLAREIPDEHWEAATDLEGWSVHDIVSHTAHLEAVLAGAPEETVAVPEGLARLDSLSKLYTEQGVIARRDRTREELVDEISTSAASRLAALRADPPTDAAGKPPKTPGDIKWPWGVLLSNRPFDVWMHEQDIRRAIGRPGGLESLGADHAVSVCGRGLPFVWGKKVAAAPGQSAAIELTDRPVRFAVTVNEDGRGAPAPDGTTTDTTVRMDTETFVVLAGGRRSADQVSVEILGDRDLGVRLVERLEMTP